MAVDANEPETVKIHVLLKIKTTLNSMLSYSIINIVMLRQSFRIGCAFCLGNFMACDLLLVIVGC